MAKPPTTVLRRMLQSATWSDLVIATATTDFKVHKCVVCPQSEFFRGACSRDFKEAHINCIQVEEDEKVIRTLLERMYEQPYEVQERKEPEDDKALGREVEHLIHVAIAADKYLVSGFHEAWIQIVAEVHRRIESPEIFTRLSNWVHDFYAIGRRGYWTALLNNVADKINGMADVPRKPKRKRLGQEEGVRE